MKKNKVSRGQKVGDKPWERLLVPDTLDIFGNFEPTVRFLRRIPAIVLLEKRRVILDFENVHSVSLSALLVLAAEIQRCRKHGGKGCLDGTYPENDRIEWMFEDTGFFKLLGVSHRTTRVKKRHPVDYIPFISDCKTEGEDFFKLQKKLFGPTIKIHESASAKLYRGVTEAMANVVEHAYPEDGDATPLPCMQRQWWLAGHIHRSRRQLLISIFDQGVGIPTTLPKKLPKEYLQAFLEKVFKVDISDGEMIKAAMTIGRTQTQHPYRGKGLIQMREVVTECPGASLHVMSLRGDYLFKSDSTEKVQNLDFSLNGTLIEWRVPLDEFVIDKSTLEEVL